MQASHFPREEARRLRRMRVLSGLILAAVGLSALAAVARALVG